MEAAIGIKETVRARFDPHQSPSPKTTALPAMVVAATHPAMEVMVFFCFRACVSCGSSSFTRYRALICRGVDVSIKAAALVARTRESAPASCTHDCCLQTMRRVGRSRTEQPCVQSRLVPRSVVVVVVEAVVALRRTSRCSLRLPSSAHLRLGPTFC